MTDLFIVGLIQGLILSLIAFGAMIPLRFLDFPDLTSEASFPIGASTCAILVFNGFNPYLSLVIATCAGAVAGIVTASINLKLKVNSLLAGIIVTAMSYSINLRILGKSNLSIFERNLVFSDSSAEGFTLIILLLLLIAGSFYLFLKTELGLKFRAVGLNKQFAKQYNISIESYTVLGLFFGNALCGLSGAITVQIQQYVDVGMGNGIVIHALAALMLGETIIGNDTIKKQIIAPLIGALLYQQIQGFAIYSGLASSDLKLLTAIILITVIAINKKQKQTSILPSSMTK